MISVVESEVEFVGFALGNCTVNVNEAAAKYLRIVHRTALELAVQNQFGADVGGFWLLTPQIEQLRQLPIYYSTKEAPLVQAAIEAYLGAQIENWISMSTSLNHDRSNTLPPAFARCFESESSSQRPVELKND